MCMHLLLCIGYPIVDINKHNYVLRHSVTCSRTIIHCYTEYIYREREKNTESKTQISRYQLSSSLKVALSFPNNKFDKKNMWRN